MLLGHEAGHHRAQKEGGRWCPLLREQYFQRQIECIHNWSGLNSSAILAINSRAMPSAPLCSRGIPAFLLAVILNKLIGSPVTFRNSQLVLLVHLAGQTNSQGSRVMNGILQ